MIHTQVVNSELRRHGIVTDILKWSRGVNSTDFNPSKRSIELRRRIIEHSLENSHRVARAGESEDDTSDVVLVFLVCRLVLEKDLETFARTIHELERRGVEFASFIVGDGPARAYMEEQLPHTLFLGVERGNEIL